MRGSGPSSAAGNRWTTCLRSSRECAAS
jgi:hypothetical protein